MLITDRLDRDGRIFLTLYEANFPLMLYNVEQELTIDSGTFLLIYRILRQGKLVYSRSIEFNEMC